ncbi:germ cell-less [Lycorma delicatula]|uniref:germ cell-less n=1 Tax=Lycorma delicatula TaxID=130591 RepID=UPI003F50FD9C
MGTTLNKFYDYFPQPVSNIYHQIGRKRKREECDEESVLQQFLEQPKKKKMICTAKYIYKTLFLDGCDYDIRVDILGKEWKLHKIYLQQCPYFASMFSGSWNESNKSYVKIEITDPNITLEALTVVFGSLYPNDEVIIEPCSVVGILAAASLFQLDGLVEQCLDIMIETISPLTAINYYNASCQYSLDSVKKATFKWFNYNLMHYYVNHPADLREVSVELIESLVRSQDLCVIQMEYSLYLMLRSWVFYKLHPEWMGDEISGLCQIQKFFKDRPKNQPEFLLTREGIEFQKAFQGLRLDKLIVHHEDLDVILEDRILPESWLYPTLISLWTSVLDFYKNIDNGPVGVPEAVFFEKCMRLGRVIESKETLSWRWNGYFMGLDLVWSITPRLITVKRDLSQSEISPLLLQHTTRHFMCRVVVISQDVQRQVTVEQKSNVMQISLAKFQEFRVMELVKDFTYPIIISVNLLVATPKTKPSEKQMTAS